MKTENRVIHRSIYDFDFILNNKTLLSLQACDFELVLNSSYHIKVHKKVLAQAAYFSAACNFHENQINSINIKHDSLRWEHFENIVLYFYTGEIDLDDRSVRQIYKFAHYLGVDSLVKLCFGYCEGDFSLSNIFQWSSFAEEALISDLGRATKEYMCENFERFAVDRELFESLTVEDVNKLVTLDGLRVTTEAKVLQLVFEYCKKFEIESTNDVFATLVSNVRFKFITSKNIESLCFNKSNKYVEIVKNFKNREDMGQKCRVYSKGIYIVEEDYVFPEIYNARANFTKLKCIRFSPLDNAVEVLPPLDVKLHSRHTFTVHNNHVHHLSDHQHHVYDTVLEKWSTLDNHFHRNFHFDSCVLKEKLYVFGVVKTNVSPSHLPMQVHCLKTGEWRQLAVKINCEPKASMRCKCVVVEGRVFIFELEGEFHLGMFRTKINRVLLFQPENYPENQEDVLTDLKNENLFRFSYMPNIFVAGKKIWFVSRSVRKCFHDDTKNLLLAVVYDVTANEFFEKTIDVPLDFFGVNQLVYYQGYVYVAHSAQGEIVRFVYDEDELLFDFFFSATIDYNYTLFRCMFSNK